MSIKTDQYKCFETAKIFGFKKNSDILILIEQVIATFWLQVRGKRYLAILLNNLCTTIKKEKHQKMCITLEVKEIKTD